MTCDLTMSVRAMLIDIHNSVSSSCNLDILEQANRRDCLVCLSHGRCDFLNLVGRSREIYTLFRWAIGIRKASNVLSAFRAFAIEEVLGKKTLLANEEMLALICVRYTDLLVLFDGTECAKRNLGPVGDDVCIWIAAMIRSGHEGV